MNNVVRNNLMTRKGYTPYCGDDYCKAMPRTWFNGEQFVCPKCNWISDFPAYFILTYKHKWGIK